MTDYNEQNSPNEAEGMHPPNGPQPPRQEPPQPERPVGDPYRTTGGNAQPGWQQVPPRQYSQYNPSTGWSGGADYNTNYRSGPQQQAGSYTWNFSEYESAEQKGKKGKKKHRGLMVFTGIVCSLFAVAVIGFAGFGVFQLVTSSGGATGPVASAPAEPESTTPQLSLKDVPRTDEAIASDGKLTPIQIATKVRPSVVGVVAYIPSTGGFYDFGNTLGQSEGSGIIMSADGYIITNAHVVSGASGIKVVLNNDEEYDAQLIGSDSATDLAVLKISADNLTPAEFGDSSALEVGEYVAAIGNPGGLMLSNSMTQGIVSGINRPLNTTDGGYTMNYIQTDAAINPGNSGGALVNEYGQVIGINSVKIAQTEFEGLGFAIPISDAKPIVDDLIANGKVTGRVRLGIEGREIDEMTARYNSIPAGFQVFKIDPAASVADLVPGDIITKIDGKDIASLGSIREYLRDFKPGDKVTLTVFRRTSGRQDSTFETTLTLIEDEGESVVQETPSTLQ